VHARILSLFQPGRFRLFLALVVLVSHTSRFDLGSWAVYTFFNLSGFWIYRMWEEKYARTSAPALVFYASRLWRILPVFWLVNLASIWALAERWDPIFNGDKSRHWGWPAALAANVLLLGYANLPYYQGALRPAWSLDVEFQFYLVFPLLLYLCTRGPGARAWRVLLVGAALAGLVAFLWPTRVGPLHLADYTAFFLIGAAAARTHWKPGTGVAAASLWAVAGCVALCWCFPGWRLLFQNDKHGATELFTHYKRIAEVVLALVSAPLAIATVHNPSGATDRKLGELTFILYLVHWPIMMVHAHFFEEVPPLQRIPSIVVAWAAVAAATWMVFAYVDQPIERWRRRWVARRLVTG
jgi:peptidoglycan/LPS O-acetylase OafA/YrhL